MCTVDDVRGDVLRPPHGITPPAVKSNQYLKKSFNSRGHIENKEHWSYLELNLCVFIVFEIISGKQAREDVHIWKMKVTFIVYWTMYLEIQKICIFPRWNRRVDTSSRYRVNVTLQRRVTWRPSSTDVLALLTGRLKGVAFTSTGKHFLTDTTDRLRAAFL